MELIGVLLQYNQIASGTKLNQNHNKECWVSWINKKQLSLGSYKVEMARTKFIVDLKVLQVWNWAINKYQGLG